MAVIGCHTAPPAADVHPPLLPTPAPQRPLAGGPAGVDNFGFVTPGIWRGAAPTAEGWASLARLGVRTVINLRESDELADVPPGVAYVHLPTSAWRADQVDVPAVCRAIAAAAKPVFVHCREGRDRTGLAVAAYRVGTGTAADAACAELRNFHVNPWWDGPIEARVRRLAADATIHP